MIPPSVHPKLLPRKDRVDPYTIALAMRPPNRTHLKS
jgi:hypothetical protein